MIRRRRRSDLRRRPRNPLTISSVINIAHEIQTNYQYNNDESSSLSPGRSTASIHDLDENAGGNNRGREKLMKRHRGEAAGRVPIPDIWEHEGLLKEWIDCSAFNASLAPPGLMSARAALMEEARRDQMDSVDHHHHHHDQYLRFRECKILGVNVL
ncbi:hypothetical protein Sjap_001156 [Stephania japonica]|uniref:Protein BIC1 n=1 Tax=Stephania japonica TaxID=461633 RepID=A0AAP0KJH2_9MAGN